MEWNIADLRGYTSTLDKHTSTTTLRTKLLDGDGIFTMTMVFLRFPLLLVVTSITLLRLSLSVLVPPRKATLFVVAAASSISSSSSTVTDDVSVSSSTLLNTTSPVCDTTSTLYKQKLSDAKDLRKRIANAVDKQDGFTLTKVGQSLRAVLDEVFSDKECSDLVRRLPMQRFVIGAGYDQQQSQQQKQQQYSTASGSASTTSTSTSTSSYYNASRKGYSGIGLKELSNSNPNTEEEKAGIAGIAWSREEYEQFLILRERVRITTEQALHLQPGTLLIDYTHISQKTNGGIHHPHADNCFHHYYNSNGNGNGSDTTTSNHLNGDDIAIIDASKSHPYPNRIAASILYLNDNISGNYKGGEFYWSNRRRRRQGQQRNPKESDTNEDSDIDSIPEMIVPPQAGRMTVFTSGIENLHGAFPVISIDTPQGNSNDNNNNNNVTNNNDDIASSPIPSRRLALAMWYVTSDEDNIAEHVPEYGSDEEDDANDDDSKTEEELDPNRILLFELPVNRIQITKLRYALGSYLTSSSGSSANTNHRSNNSKEWTVTQKSSTTLYLVYASDQNAMLSIVLKPTKIVLSRHTDGRSKPSLVYQLQESVLLHGILTELEKHHNHRYQSVPSASSSSSFVTFRTMTDIEKARNTLPTRQ